MPTPVALTIAGSDSSSGAGIQADLKTFSALEIYGVTAVTCIVAEAPGKVSSIEAVSPVMVHDQIDVVLQAFPVAAVKTGLLCNARIVSAVAERLHNLNASRRARIPLVVDPVMIATSGAELLEPKALEVYRSELFPLATLITPNLNEAAKLVGREIRDCDAMKDAARELSAVFNTGVLVKGGHLRARDAVDVLASGNTLKEFSLPYVDRVSTHGTGCTYSAAITAGLACSLPLEDAIAAAKKFVTRSIEQHLSWKNVHALKHWR